MDLANTARDFSELSTEDKDLTMFTHLKLEKKDQVAMNRIIKTPITRFEAGETGSGCPDGICDLYLLTTKYIIQNTKCIKIQNRWSRW